MTTIGSLVPDAARSEPIIALLLIVTCVAVAASSLVPVWFMTLLLWIMEPLLLWRFGSEYAPWSIIHASLHPVLIVFLAGFVFAAAAERHGIDEKFARIAVRLSRGDHYKLVILLATATVWLSAWISNVAAAALMFGAVRPILRDAGVAEKQRRSILIAIAIAANIGGMATPIGTGANAVALAAISEIRAVTFAEWMIFAVPLTVLMTAVLLAFTSLRAAPGGDRIAASAPTDDRPLHRRTAIIFATTVVAWVSEPIHGVATHTVALIAVTLLFVTHAVTWRELLRLDWGSLLLIAGGIGIGAIMSRSGAAHMLMETVPIDAAHPGIMLFTFCFFSASLAAVMSNTGTAALLIPIALALLPNPSTAILVALATALGFPFVVSTPANVMAVRNGVPSSSLLRASLPTMVLGSALLAFTGPYILRLLGIP